MLLTLTFTDTPRMNLYSLVLWSWLILQIMAGKQQKHLEPRFCDYNKHKYFYPQVPRCKRCNKCGIGWGLVSVTDEAIRLNPVHGAMSCQRCEECVAGRNFSNNLSYKPCKPCKNCTALGKEEWKRCTPSSNTKCQRITLPLESKTDVPCNTTNTESHGGDVIEKSQSDLKWGIALVVLVICLMVTAPCALLWVRGRRRHVLRAKKLKTGRKRIPQPSAVFRPLVFQDGPLNETDLCLPAAHLVKDEDYYELGLQLGIPSYSIDIIKADCRGNSKRKSFEVLNKWKKMRGTDAIRSVFYAALRRINRADVIAEMEKERRTDNKNRGDYMDESAC